jgi:hypothetical protein
MGSPSSWASTSYSTSLAETSTRQKSQGTPHPLPPQRRMGNARRSAATLRRPVRGASPSGSVLVRSAEADPFIRLPCSSPELHLAADVHSTMRRKGGGSKYCYACGQPFPAPRRRHRNVINGFRRLAHQPVGFTLPVQALSAIFPTARVRIIKRSTLFGVYERRTEEIAARYSELQEILRDYRGLPSSTVGTRCCAPGFLLRNSHASDRVFCA